MELVPKCLYESCLFREERGEAVALPIRLLWSDKQVVMGASEAWGLSSERTKVERASITLHLRLGVNSRWKLDMFLSSSSWMLSGRGNSDRGRSD